MTPNLTTWRPCDSVESAVAWKAAIQKQNGPSALIFSRQNLPHQQRDNSQIKAIEKGAYILLDCDGTPDAILIATGSEVGIAVDAAKTLTAQGKNIRVVSMPSTTVFDQQPNDYQESVLPETVSSVIAIETAHADFWHKYVGKKGEIIAMTSFGESAPGSDLLDHFGFTAENIINTTLNTITKNSSL